MLPNFFIGPLSLVLSYHRTIIGSAAAFAPAPVAKTTSAVNAFEGELGAQPPLGFFDPLGLLDDADQDRFDRLRYVEVKHGRIAQLAFLGQIVTRAGIHLGGNIFMDGTQFSDIGDGYSSFASLGSKSIAQIVFFVGILELGVVMKDSANGAAPGDFPGDFRNGSLDFGWDSFDEETKLSKRAIELNNGRAAMMGILGLMVHEQLGTNLPIIGQM